MGANSGLVYGLLGSTLTVFFTEHIASLSIIGLISLRTIPYSVKFVWSPVVDILRIKFFAKRVCRLKSWMVSMQILMIISLLLMSVASAYGYVKTLCVISLLMAFCTATFDIALEAYRVSLFKPKSKSNALVILGFRLGLVFSGVLALYLSSMVGWSYTFVMLALLIIPCLFVIALSQQMPKSDNEVESVDFKTFCSMQKNAVTEFLKLRHLTVFLVIIAFFKVSDAFLSSMLIPFFLEIGYNKEEIASAFKAVSIIAAVLGTSFGAILISRFNIIAMLFIAEILSSLTNLMFIPLINSSVNIELLIAVNFIESFCSAISNIALISFMSSLCKGSFVATNFAILISVSKMNRSIFAAVSGIIVDWVGWKAFFITSSLLSIPTFLAIYLLSIKKKDNIQHVNY